MSAIYPKQAWVADPEVSFLTPLLKAENASPAARLQGGNVVVGLARVSLLSFPNANNRAAVNMG